MTKEQFGTFATHARRVFTMVDEALSKPTGDGAVIAWQVRLDAWKATLADVPYEDALRCLDAIHRGDAGEDLKYPNDWRDRFPAVVRKWCRANKSLVLTPPTAGRDDHQPRYACLVCRDTGHVVAINAAFAAEHRHLVEGPEPLVRDDEALDPRNADLVQRLRAWFLAAKKWCRLEGCGPFVSTCVCYCNSRVAVAKRQAIQDRQATGCVYKPEKMPRVAAEDFLSLWEGFERYVQETPASVAHEWDPSQPLIGYSE